MKEVPKTFVVHVSADNRYNLYVNGSFICEGPVKSDFLHWNYESVDIAPYLHPGTNVIAAQVYNFGNYRQPSQFSRYTAFILQGDLPDQYFVNSNETWKVYHNNAYSPIVITEQMAHGFYVTGPCDSLDAAKYPVGMGTGKVRRFSMATGQRFCTGPRNRKRLYTWHSMVAY